MTKKVFTIGYSGRTQDELVKALQDRGAVLFDIRFSPNSRNQEFAGWSLKRRLGEDRYAHVPALGNKNYKNGGPIEIVNYEIGKSLIQSEPRPVVLMCACKDYVSCHRCTVATMLGRDGFEVEEITLGSEESDNGYVQQPLF